MKIIFDAIPRRLVPWMPPLIVIPAMLALGNWGGETARFFLFSHHLFWIIGGGLLINPITATLWPSSQDAKRQPALPRRSRAQKRQAGQKSVSTRFAETPAARLARLRKEKEEVDRKIEGLTIKGKEHVK